MSEAKFDKNGYMLVNKHGVTIEDMGDYSDSYKEVNGFRPKGTWDEMTPEALKVEMDYFSAHWEEENAMFLVRKEEERLQAIKDEHNEAKWLKPSQGVGSLADLF
jgi:hypothetical protein